MRPSAHSLPRRVGLAALVVLLIGAYGLRLYDLNGPSVWHDEAWSIRAIRDPIDTPDDNTPPVYYSLMHLLYLGAGDTPLALRYGSLLLDLLTIALATRLVRRWASWDAAILAAVLLGASPLLWAYAREVRAYVAVPLLAVVLLGLVDSLLAARARFPWQVWGALLAAELILLYTHNLSVPVVAWLNLVVGGVWLWRWAWRWLAIWLAGQAAMLVAYLPWLRGQEPSGTALNTPPALGADLLSDIWQAYFTPVPAMIGAETALVVGSAVFAALTVVALAAALAWRPDRRTWLLISQAALLPALATAELIAASIDFHPRYYIAGVPALLMLVARGLDSLPDAYDARRLAVPAGMAIAAAVAAASLVPLLDKPAYQHDDFRAVARYYATLPADALIVLPYGREYALDSYYAEKEGIRAKLVGVDLHSDAETAIAQINAALAGRDGPVHVELLTWYQLPADVRGMYPCLLEAAGARLEDFTVQGLHTQAYWLERPLALGGEAMVTQADFGAIQLVGAALEGEPSVCVRTSWELAAAGDDDWRVAARIPVPASAQWIIGSADSDIRRDDQAPTSAWDAGDRGDAFSLISLPDGVPPGEYPVQVRVYSESRPNGLDRVVDGAPLGGTTLDVAAVRKATPDALPVEPGDLAPKFVADDAVLFAVEGATDALNPGQELRITLHWWLPSTCCLADPWTGADLVLRGADGTEYAREPVRVYNGYSRDWHALTVPADAVGEAVLAVEAVGVEPATLVTYTIRATDHLFAAPPYDVAVDAVYPGVAALEGVSVRPLAVSTGDTVELTLVWRALGTASRPYTVFTHLLADDPAVGQVGGHDGPPTMHGEERAMTSWVQGEYIVDRHVLAFEDEDRAFVGTARLEVGLYDPESFERVRLANGADHIILPTITITVQ